MRPIQTLRKGLVPVPIVQSPCGGSKFKVQEFKVILRPVPTVSAVSNVPLLRSVPIVPDLSKEMIQREKIAK
jgi:hypothetical protein